MTQTSASSVPIDVAFEAALRAHAGGDALLVVHSSLAHLRPPVGDAKWPLLRAIKRLAASGFTLAFPTFTFSFCGGQPFDTAASPSETGVLGAWVLDLEGAVRSAHPIYSYALIGPLASKLAAAKNTTTFGDDSIFAAFESERARLVMLGCGWVYNTQFHRYEEKAHVPYRYFKTFTGSARFAGESAHQTDATMFVRDLDLDAENDFSPVVTDLRNRDLIRATSLWDGQVESAACTDVAAAAQRLLAADALSLISNRREVAYKLKQRKVRETAPPLRIALLGNANMALVEKALAASLRALMKHRTFELFTVPYGQLFGDVFSEGSDLAEFKADIAFFVNRLEDLTGNESADHADPAMLDAALERYHAAVAHYLQSSGATVVACHLVRGGAAHDGLAALRADGGVSAKIAAFNTELSRTAEADGRLHVFDLEGHLARRKSASGYDPRLWHLGRFPFSEGFSEELALAFTGLVLAHQGRASRLIVVDLDNTLWGGVLGEDGPEGLKIGGDFPGNAFLTLQRTLKALHQRGIALAISSKNDTDQVMALLRDDERMALRPTDFAAIRANWQAKAENIAAICEELDLGLEHVLFVDDNPVERDLVRRFAPEVKVLDLPHDPTLYADALLRCPWLGALALTTEDRQRGRQYAARRQVLESKSSFADLTSFYHSLDTELTLEKLQPGNRARAGQLSVKTNQFNTTTRRYDERALDALIAEGATVAVIRSKDKYSEPENIGLIILRPNMPEPGALFVDNYLLSCRALGRGIEVGLLRWIAQAARQQGFVRLAGEIVRTERNKPASVVFQDAGFTPAPGSSPDAGNSTWTLDIAGGDLPGAPWLRVDDRSGFTMAQPLSAAS